MMIPSVGDLIEIVPSYCAESDDWISNISNSKESRLKAGDTGIIVEKTSSQYEETSDQFDYKVLIDGVLYENISDFMFIVKDINPL